MHDRVRLLLVRFQAYSICDVVSIFEAKLILIEVFGKSVGTRKLRDIVKVLRKSDDTREVSYLELEQLADNLFPKDFDMIKSHYKLFDKNNKGWITEDDFVTQLTSIAPHYSHKYGSLLFNAANENQCGVITMPQYHALISKSP